MCWFNPLMWVAVRKSAEDIERSCDETVLLGADTAERKAYGRLLLDTAGDERGFTTCLSASAKAMRYRLQGVMGTGRRRSGALIVGLIAFLLCMTNGYVALAYGSLSGAEVIYGEEGYEAYTLRSVSLDEDRFNTTYEICDEDGVPVGEKDVPNRDRIAAIDRLAKMQGWDAAEKSVTEIAVVSKGEKETLISHLVAAQLKLKSPTT
jgi:hypothetical protein